MSFKKITLVQNDITKINVDAMVNSANKSLLGNLPAKHLIHTVGPRWLGGSKNEAEELCNAYLNSLVKANEVKAKSISFPNISTGVYNYPKQEAAEIAIGTVLSSPPSFEHIEHVYFICYDQENYNIYKSILSNLDDSQIQINIL